MKLVRKLIKILEMLVTSVIYVSWYNIFFLKIIPGIHIFVIAVGAFNGGYGQCCLSYGTAQLNVKLTNTM